MPGRGLTVEYGLAHPVECWMATAREMEREMLQGYKTTHCDVSESKHPENENQIRKRFII